MGAAFVPRRAAALRQRLRREYNSFHWSETDEAGKLRFLALLTNLGVDLRATVARQVLSKAQETGRARCFGALVTDLAGVGGMKLTIDKRDTPAKNARDTAQINGFIQRGVLDASFQHAFEKPPAEPIIWIADAVAGAVQAQFTDQDSQFIQAILGQLRMRVLP